MHTATMSAGDLMADRILAFGAGPARPPTANFEPYGRRRAGQDGPLSYV